MTALRLLESLRSLLATVAVFFPAIVLAFRPFCCFHFGHDHPIGLSSVAATRKLSSIPTWGESDRRITTTSIFMSSTKPKKQTKSTVVVDGENMDDDNPLEPVGTKFFGGAAQKEELYDAEVEERADEIMRQLADDKDEQRQQTIYRKFDNRDAFFDDFAKKVAEQLQSEINGVLYEEQEEMGGVSGPTKSIYGLDTVDSLTWVTPFGRSQTSRTPLDEMRKSLEFYRRVDVALVSAKTVAEDSSDNTGNSKQRKVDVGWSLSVVWPNFWEARVLLTGKSILTLDEERQVILRQVDFLDNGGKDGKDLINALAGQILPRFWDLYHIAMTPSAEVLQRLPLSFASEKRPGFLSKYNLFEVAPRLVLRPTMVDTGGREMRAAQGLPNHAFSCIIKTVGPRKQRYVPTTPLEVQIKSGEKDHDGGKRSNRILWTVSVPVELMSGSKLPLPSEEDDPNSASSSYEFQPRRRIATLPFGGNPQDEEVAELRKELFDSVRRDGFSPKKDAEGRPQFLFLQNEAKTCFTEDGLGMAVYESRPAFARTNEVGIELECN